jgi:hypothetical protein
MLISPKKKKKKKKRKRKKQEEEQEREREREREREYAIKFIIWWVLLKAVWNREIVISDESIRVRNHMDKLILTLLKMA